MFCIGLKREMFLLGGGMQSCKASQSKFFTPMCDPNSESGIQGEQGVDKLLSMSAGFVPLDGLYDSKNKN